MKLRKILALVLVLALAVTSFAGCAGRGAASSSAAEGTESKAESTAESTAESKAEESTPESTATATAGGEVIVNLGSEPPEMNSITTTSTGSMNVYRHLMDGLVILDPTDKPIPAIAEKWDISDDNMTYTFHLRKDAKWTNGDNVVAGDFIFAWNQLFTVENGAPYASTWATYVKGAAEMLADGTTAEGVGYKAIDDYTIELNLAVPCDFILQILAFPNFYPMNQKFYEQVGGLESYGKDADAFCTNGAFKVDSWAHESEFIVTKNPDYYAASEINLDKITFAMIVDSTTAYNSFVTNEIDMVGLTADQVEQAKAGGFEAQLAAYDDASCWYLEYGVDKVPALKNAKVRQALIYAIDAEQFITSIVKNNSTVAYSFTPPAVLSGEFTKKVGKLMDREGYAADDYAKAKTLLEEGLKEEGLTAADLKLTIIADDGDVAQKNCAFFQEQWKTHLGITVEVQQMTYKNRLERMNNHDFDIVMAGWGPDYNDPMTFMDLWVTGGGNNHTGWSNADYDALIKKAAEDANPETRTATLIEAEKLLMNEMPIGPIYNRSRDYMTSEKLQGVVRTGFDDLNLRWASVK